jgi:pimeloyl-ACP methyl ester carboxylesterase
VSTVPCRRRVRFQSSALNLECISLGPDGGTEAVPILFIHGSYHAAWCWREHWMPYFAERGFVTHALSLRGHGGSGGEYRGARLADYISDVRTVISRLDRAPVLIGHSLGGYIV